MFDFFNRRTSKDFMDEAKEKYGVTLPKDTDSIATEPKSKGIADDCLYTVGTTPSGQTVLKIGDGYSTMTLTMNDAATRQMIRMLEATLPEGDGDVETD